MSVTIRYTRRGAGVVEGNVPPKDVAARLEALCRQRIAAKAEDRHGWAGESWKNPEGRWAWSCVPVEDMDGQPLGVRLVANPSVAPGSMAWDDPRVPVFVRSSPHSSPACPYCEDRPATPPHEAPRA